MLLHYTCIRFQIGHNPLGVAGAKEILKGVGYEHCVITLLDLSVSINN